MKKIIQKIKNTDMSWKKVVIFAIIIGIYTGLINVIPFLKNTSFQDIAVTHEWWVFFALIIIFTQKKPLDAGLKTLIFFLISQTVIFLVEWPFEGQFFYAYWFRWMEVALLTGPAGFLIWYGKKDNLFGRILLSGPLGLLLYIGIDYLSFCLSPNIRHILTVIFCFTQIIFWILYLNYNKKDILKTIFLLMCVWTIIVVGYYVYKNISSEPETFDNVITCNMNDKEYYFGIILDDNNVLGFDAKSNTDVISDIYDYTNVDDLIKHIKNYFESNNGTCFITKK